MGQPEWTPMLAQVGDKVTNRHCSNKLRRRLHGARPAAPRRKYRLAPSFHERLSRNPRRSRSGRGSQNRPDGLGDAHRPIPVCTCFFAARRFASIRVSQRRQVSQSRRLRSGRLLLMSLVEIAAERAEWIKRPERRQPGNDVSWATAAVLTSVDWTPLGRRRPKRRKKFRSALACLHPQRQDCVCQLADLARLGDIRRHWPIAVGRCLALSAVGGEPGRTASVTRFCPVLVMAGQA